MDGGVTLPIVFSAVALLLIVIVVAPFAVCCFFRPRSSDSESGHLLEGNQLNSATAKRESYGGTPSASHVSPTSKYKSSVRYHPPPDTHSTKLPKTREKVAENTEPPSKYKSSVRSHHPLRRPAHTLGPSSTPSPVTVPRSSSTLSKSTRGREKMMENAEALDERGQGLSVAQERTAKLEDGAAAFASDADKLLLKLQEKNSKKKKKKKSKKPKP